MQKEKVHFNTQKVRLMMQEQAITAHDLCQRAAISFSCYQESMKTGRCKIATLGRIANVLDAFVSELLEESEKGA